MPSLSLISPIQGYGNGNPYSHDFKISTHRPEQPPCPLATQWTTVDHVSSTCGMLSFSMSQFFVRHAEAQHITLLLPFYVKNQLRVWREHSHKLPGGRNLVSLGSVYFLQLLAQLLAENSHLTHMC